jgi:hypothetical protein
MTISKARLKLAGLVVGSMLALAGCSSAAPSASAGSPPPAASAQDGASGNAQFEWELTYVHCLQGQGIDIADPDPVTGIGEYAHNDALAAASKICADRVGSPPQKSSASDEQLYQGQLTVAKCLRKNGVDVDDPIRGEAMRMPEGEVDPNAIAKCVK